MGFGEGAPREAGCLMRQTTKRKPTWKTQRKKENIAKAHQRMAERKERGPERPPTSFLPSYFPAPPPEDGTQNQNQAPLPAVGHAFDNALKGEILDPKLMDIDDEEFKRLKKKVLESKNWGVEATLKAFQSFDPPDYRPIVDPESPHRSRFFPIVEFVKIEPYSNRGLESRGHGMSIAVRAVNARARKLNAHRQSMALPTARAHDAFVVKSPPVADFPKFWIRPNPADDVFGPARPSQYGKPGSQRGGLFGPGPGLPRGRRVVHGNTNWRDWVQTPRNPTVNLYLAGAFS
ncbi:hypothetical protein OQA88_6930 [Cercophora sp. LCS_1]